MACHYSTLIPRDCEENVPNSTEEMNLLWRNRLLVVPKRANVKVTYARGFLRASKNAGESGIFQAVPFRLLQENMSELSTADREVLDRLEAVLGSGPVKTEPLASATSPATFDTDSEMAKKQAEIERLKAALATKTATKSAAEEAAARKMAEQDAEIARLKEALATKTATKLATVKTESDRKMAEKEAEIARLKEAVATKTATKAGVAESSSSISKPASTAVKATVAVDTKTRDELARMAREKAELEAELLELEKVKSRISTSSALDSKVDRSGHTRTISELERKMAEVTREATSSKATVQAEAAKYLRRAKALDLVFLMDCTGSMGPWIAAAKESIRGVIAAAKELEQGAYVRVAFVGYRDIGDARRFEIIRFVEPSDEAGVSNMTTNIAGIAATGGDDGPEDVAGGLKHVLDLQWYAGTRVLLHIADAPCHGRQYHNYDDDYPGGDPSGLVPENLLLELAEKNVDLYFGKITSHTDSMIDVFNEKLKTIQRSIKTVPISSDPKMFLPAVINTMKESWKRSEVRRTGLLRSAAETAALAGI
eukprot:TRINITY_DN1074_c0_g1_i2.p1 TRINITY_DN1074_c0_g1~~TRINITY_DN1074_c0_g1_i2.p1  ORF type:complete len:542 (+),score=115.89 TRINITY_DN1074_c0_g1_i2:1680-3305(+)